MMGVTLLSAYDCKDKQKRDKQFIWGCDLKEPKNAKGDSVVHGNEGTIPCWGVLGQLCHSNSEKRRKKKLRSGE